MPITDEHIDHYREHGYAIVESLLTPDEIKRTLDEIETLHPGWVDFLRDPTGARPEDWARTGTNRRQVRFTFPGEQLNRNTLHPELRRFASIMAGGNPIVCEQSDLSFKSFGHPSDQEQQMHCDYANHTLTYPPDLPRYWQTAYLLYYTDVDEDLAPTAVCSKQHYPERILAPAVYSPEARPALYENEVKGIDRAGGSGPGLQRMRTFHRGTRFKRGRRAARPVQSNHTMHADPGCPWVGIVGWPEQAVYGSFRRWIEAASLDERELLGFPAPGHPYWTVETLDGRWPRAAPRHGYVTLPSRRLAAQDDRRAFLESRPGAGVGPRAGSGRWQRLRSGGRAWPRRTREARPAFCYWRR